MTRYFDDMHERLRKAEADWEAGRLLAFVEAESVERDLLRDCQLVASLPGFPPDLLDEMQLVFARRVTEPLCHVRVADEDEAATFKRLHDLVWETHSVFHEVNARGLNGFSDKPDSDLAARAAALEDRRLAVMRARPEFAAAVAEHDAGVTRVRAELEKP